MGKLPYLAPFCSALCVEIPSLHLQDQFYQEQETTIH